MIQQAIQQVIQRRDLTESEMTDVMEYITDGRATPAQIGAFLAALRMKGETIDEITGAARVMRARCTRIPHGNQGPIIDTCGTGGDGSGTFNVSTTTAFVMAGAGLKVAKHGNRAVSSRCGSADVLEALGVNLELTPEETGLCLEQVGLAFLFAPKLHSAMRHVVGPRREMGLRTIFNVLGPLTNPAGATHQLLGVYHADLTETLAQVLAKLGCQGACVVNGMDGMDEVSLSAPTRVSRLRQGQVETFVLTPGQAGLAKVRPAEVQGGDAQHNATVTHSVLAGVTGSERDLVLLNSAVAFLAADRVEDLREGVALAAQTIDSGQALAKLHELVDFGRSLGEPGRMAV